MNYSSREMASVLSGLLRERSFDLVDLDSIHLLSYERFFQERSIPVVYDWHNIESEAMSRYGETVGSLARRTYAVTARKLASAEREILRRTFGHIVCSRRELELLQAMNGSARVTVVQNGVDLRLLQDREPDTGRARRRVVFVGSMSYHANIDAACWFAGSIWPGIRERYPQWVLTLVGSNPRARRPRPAGGAGRRSNRYGARRQALLPRSCSGNRPTADWWRHKAQDSRSHGGIGSRDFYRNWCGRVAGA